MSKIKRQQVAGANCSAMEQRPFQKRVSPKNQRSRGNLLKMIVLSCVMFCVSVGAWGQSLNTQQTKLQNDIVTYLRGEGFSPSIDKDGDIVFKKEGKSYFVEIDSRDTSPFYLVLKRGTYDEDGLNKQKAMRAANKAQAFKGIKVNVYDISVYIEAQMFLQDAEHFKSVFYKMMSLIGYAMSEFIDVYNE